MRQGGSDSKPDVMQANALRRQVKADGMLARVPTPTEDEFLGDQHKQRGYGRAPDVRPVH